MTTSPELAKREYWSREGCLSSDKIEKNFNISNVNRLFHEAIFTINPILEVFFQRRFYYIPGLGFQGIVSLFE